MKTLFLLGAVLAASTVRAQTISTFDVLVATRNLTVVGTTTLSGSAFSVGGATLTVNNGFVGIGTTTPSAPLHIVGAPISGYGVQLLWISSVAAFRAGEVDGPYWDPSNIGDFSTAFGWDSKASGPSSTVGGGANNTAAGVYSVVAGGAGNTALGNYGSIGGGGGNTTSDTYATIGGGAGNHALDVGTVAGGQVNRADRGSFVGGGELNSADLWGGVAAGTENMATGFFAFVGAGTGNGAGDHATIGGGAANYAVGLGCGILGGGILSDFTWAGNSCYGAASVVLGGVYNDVTGDYATVLGGYNNYAQGYNSLAAGRLAQALAPGSFVWADSQNLTLASNTTDEFRLRAGGGYVFLSTPTLPTTIVSGGAMLISTSALAATAVPNLFISSVTGFVGVETKNPGASLDVDGSAQFGSGAAKSTFTATPGGPIYALQLSSGISIAAGGIRWADGSISVTASTGSAGVGRIVQSTSTTKTNEQTITTVIPDDDTIPQNTEGTEVFTVTITPTSSTSLIRITGQLNYSSPRSAAAALFKDSGANALWAYRWWSFADGLSVVGYFQFEETSGSTSARTYKIRMGNDASSAIYVNGDNLGNRRYGGVATSFIRAEEISQ